MKNLTEILTENNIEVQDSSGGRRVARCPFHEGDRDPSFTIYPNDTYFCWGCEKWGDAVKFLVEFKGISYKEASDYVGVDFSIKKEDKAKVIKFRNAIETWKLIGDVSEQYHQYLLGQPGAIAYLHKRGLTDETISKYKIGYTDGRVLNIQYAHDMSLAVEIGLVNRDGYEALSHRITIPNLLERGEADFLIGRTVTNDRIKYLGLRVPKPIHGFYAVRRSPIIFLAEGQFDWLTLCQWGFPAAILGGSHLSKHHQTLLASKSVIVVPDNDTVGESAYLSLESKLPQVSSVHLGDCGVKDVSELAGLPNGREIFIKLVKEQVPWIMSMSMRILDQYFPNLKNEILSL